MFLPITTMAASPCKGVEKSGQRLNGCQFPKVILLATFGKSRERAGLQYISTNNKIADGQRMHFTSLKRLWV
jgi:hypothetical protein